MRLRSPREAATSLEVWGVATARTFRAHWAMAELSLDYEIVPYGSRTGETQSEEFKQLNPRQKIPVLRDGDLVIAESAAIVNHLGSRYGNDTLVPAEGSDRRALYDQWCFFVAMELDAHTLYVLRKHVDLAELYGEAPAAAKEAREGFDRQVRVAAGEIEARGPYLLGESFSGADILLGTCLDWAVHYGFELPPSLDAYHARLRARPAYRQAFDKNFKLRPELMPRALD